MYYYYICTKSLYSSLSLYVDIFINIVSIICLKWSLIGSNLMCSYPPFVMLHKRFLSLFNVN